jgi:ABC-2 type transport system permease protein
MMKVLRLVSVQLWIVLGEMLAIGTKQKKKAKVLYTGIAFFTLLMSAIAFFYCFMIGTGLKMFNSIQILPALMMSITSMIVLFTTTFKVKGTIFGFRDYDMVMSLPVSTGGIVASRLIILYLINFMFVCIIMIPMMIAYGILARPEATFYLFGIILTFFIPLVPIVVASFLGTIIAYAASKFRYSNLLNIVFSLALLTTFVGLSFTMGDSGQELVDMSKNLTDQVNSLYPLAAMFTEAVTAYDITAFVSFLAISLFAFCLYTILVGKAFKKINTLIMTGSYRSNYKMGELHTSSPMKALYIKELKRFFSSPSYVLNTGIGVVLLTVGAIALLFVDLGEVLGDPQATSALKNSGPLFISFCVMMTCTTMASISLEGKNLWIIKSLPISPKTIYKSKIAVNLTIAAPALLDAILVGIALKAGFLQTVFMVLLTIVSSVFIALYGLLMNLLLPNFNWTSDVAVVKQSASSMASVFSGFGVIAIQTAILFLIPNMVLAYLSYILLMGIVDFVLYRTIMTYGVKRFAQL